MHSMYGRRWKLVIGTGSEAVETTELRVAFEIEKTRFSTAHTAKITVYNLSQKNRNRIKEEFDKIVLYAGYANPGLIFSGDIMNVTHMKTGVDWVTEIYAGDGIKALSTSKINKSFIQGTSPETLFNELIGSMEGIAKGSLEGIKECIKKRRSILKSIILSGSVKKFLDELAENCLFDYQINDGVLDTRLKTFSLPSTPDYVISQANGMLGSPELTEVGLNVTTLLRPGMKVGKFFRVESISAKINVGNQFYRKVKKTTEGTYRIEKITHRGDTHSDEWSTSIEGVRSGG